MTLSEWNALPLALSREQVLRATGMARNTFYKCVAAGQLQPLPGPQRKKKFAKVSIAQMLRLPA